MQIPIRDSLNFHSHPKATLRAPIDAQHARVGLGPVNIGVLGQLRTIMVFYFYSVKTFRYQGGPKDQTSSRADESSFPEFHEGGEYRWNGTSHGLDSGGRDGDELPEARVATAIWHSDDGRTNAEEYRKDS